MINRVKAVWNFVTSPDYSRTVSILALLVVVLAIPLTVFIAQKQQEIRQRAATTCTDTYDGLTFASQTPEVKDLFGNDEQAWIQAHNAELAKNPPLDNNQKSLFDQPCNIITMFYAVHKSNAPQQWVNESNAASGGSPGECNAEEKTYTTACGFNGLNWFANGGSGDTGWVDGPKVQVSCGSDKILKNQGKYCDANGKKRFIGSSSCVADSSCPAAPKVDACNKSCTLTNQDQGGKAAPSQCTGNTYFYVQTEGWPQGQCSTACLPCPANTKPADDKCSCVAVPTLTPTPTPVTMCGLECKSFTDDSIKDPSACNGIDQYIHRVYYSGPGGSPPQQCKFGCNQLDPGYKQKTGGCEQEPIPVSTTAPPCIGCNGDGPGEPAPPGPGPGVPAPTTPPAGALTKLLFDLILPGATKDKRIVAQIFTTTPTPITPTPTPTAPPTITPTPTPTPLPNQIGQDLEGTVKRGPGGNFTGTVDVVNTIASGTYDIKVKAPKYLRKLIRGIQITQDTTNRISQITLVLGDINGDNRLNIADYNILIDCFGTKANSQTCGNNNKDLADLDDNGRVDGVDYNLFLINLSKGPREGD